MNVKSIESKAHELREQLGGNIFSFPIEEDNPLSLYAVAIFSGEQLATFPDPMTIEEAAAGISMTLEELGKMGRDSDYDRNVRMVSYDAQMNGPSVTMRRLRKAEEGYQKVMNTNIEDFIPSDDGYNMTARGLIKLSYELVKKKRIKKLENLWMSTTNYYH